MIYIPFNQYLHFINIIKEHFLYTDRVKWNELEEEIKYLKKIKRLPRDKIFLELIVYYLDDRHSQIIPKSVEQINNEETQEDFQSAFSYKIIKNKLIIVLSGSIDEYKPNSLKNHYKQLSTIFKKYNIYDIELDISNFHGGSPISTILFLKFLFRVNDMKNICYLINRDHKECIDLSVFKPLINSSVPRIKYFNEVRTLTIRIGINTYSSGEALCVMFSSCYDRYEKIKFIGNDTSGEYNTATEYIDFGEYIFGIAKYNFMNSMRDIFVGSISVKDMNTKIKKYIMFDERSKL